MARKYKEARGKNECLVFWFVDIVHGFTRLSFFAQLCFLLNGACGVRSPCQTSRSKVNGRKGISLN